MSSSFRGLVVVVVGFALLVFQSGVLAARAFDGFVPNLLLPMVIFLGVSPEVHVVRGAVVSFVLGVMADSFSGSSIGLHTFVLVAIYLVARGAGLRFFLRGPAFQVGLAFVVALLAGGTALALRAIFEAPAPFSTPGVGLVVGSLLKSALATAVVAPIVFVMVARIEQVGRRREDAGGLAA